MSGSETHRPRALIVACRGPSPSAEEVAFFGDADPLGFILFGDNCRSPAQVRDLVSALRESVGRPDAPVLIDQEGGRVARLRPPHWREAPPAARFGDLAARDLEKGLAAVRLNARLLAADLADLGITVDCAPVLDVPAPGSHDVIGDRAFSRDPKRVAQLGRAFCEGLLEGGVAPVAKHIPGHGRALADSHAELPAVEASRADLEATDFLPFRELADVPWAMAAHVLYKAIDPDAAATTSPRVISEVIRGHIGFRGFLLSDDLNMEALTGTLADRARRVLEAGCDAVLHCTAELREMETLAQAIGPLSEEAAARFARAEALRGAPPEVDRDRLAAALDDLLGAA